MSKSALTLYDQIGFDTFVESFTAATLHDQWNARVVKVGAKFFVALGGAKGLWRNQLVFKTTPLSYEIMRGQTGIVRAPYTQRNWLAIAQDSDLSDEEIRAYIKQSYKLVAQKLTKKQRLELKIIL